jgi:hypothetical protein
VGRLLDILGWPLHFNLLALIAAPVTFAHTLLFLLRKAQIEPVGLFGWGNMALACAIVAWYTADVLFARRSIYAFFGEVEGQLRHGLRFWRRVTLLILAIGGIGAAVVVRLDPDGVGTLNKDSIGPIAILTGAFLASFGWMYTRFEQDKADRASATLSAIRDQMYNDRTRTIYEVMALLSTHCVKKLNAPEDRPFSKAELELRTTDQGVLTEGERNALPDITHEAACDEFISRLDQLAFGVRQGQFDLETIRQVLRPRFVKIAFRYFENIRTSTVAERDHRYGRYRATKRTWEHFLWLTTKMEVLTSDKGISHKFIILPPERIVGQGDGTVVPAPGRRRLIPEGELTLGRLFALSAWVMPSGDPVRSTPVAASEGDRLVDEESPQVQTAGQDAGPLEEDQPAA